MIMWMRPSGNTIETPDTPNMLAVAKANGWVRDKPKAEKPKAEAKPKKTPKVEKVSGNSSANSKVVSPKDTGSRK